MSGGIDRLDRVFTEYRVWHRWRVLIGVPRIHEKAVTYIDREEMLARVLELRNEKIVMEETLEAERKFEILDILVSEREIFATPWKAITDV